MCISTNAYNTQIHITYIHAPCIHISLSSATKRVWLQEGLVAMSLLSVYILVSKYHYPLKRIRTPGERIDSQGREYELENLCV